MVVKTISASQLIPLIIISCLKGKELPVYGDGKNIRDWLFVDDHCDAITQALLNGKAGGSYNISAGNEIDNLTIVNKILSIMDKPSDLIEFVEDRPGHDLRYSLDSSKITKELGWLPKTNFEDGITKTTSWYLSNDSWIDSFPDSVTKSTPWK